MIRHNNLIHHFFVLIKLIIFSVNWTTLFSDIFTTYFQLMFVSSAAVKTTKVSSKSSLTVSGAQFVATHGDYRKLGWHVDRWDLQVPFGFH